LPNPIWTLAYRTDTCVCVEITTLASPLGVKMQMQEQKKLN